MLGGRYLGSPGSDSANGKIIAAERRVAQLVTMKSKRSKIKWMYIATQAVKIPQIAFCSYTISQSLCALPHSHPAASSQSTSTAKMLPTYSHSSSEASPSSSFRIQTTVQPPRHPSSHPHFKPSSLESGYPFPTTNFPPASTFKNLPTRAIRPSSSRALNRSLTYATASRPSISEYNPEK